MVKTLLGSLGTGLGEGAFERLPPAYVLLEVGMQARQREQAVSFFGSLNLRGRGSVRRNRRPHPFPRNDARITASKLKFRMGIHPPTPCRGLRVESLLFFHAATVQMIHPQGDSPVYPRERR